MNKEELLKTLEEWKEFRKSKNHELQYYQLAEVIHLVEQLDEPQKVKVPPYVAAWIEQAKKECRTFFEVLSDIEGACFYHKGDEPTYKWVFDNDNGVKHQEIFARAWLDGYEIEKEPKWWVVMQGGSEVWYLQGFRNSLDGDIVKQWCSYEGCIKFTDRKKAEAVALLVDGSVEEV